MKRPILIKIKRTLVFVLMSVCILSAAFYPVYAAGQDDGEMTPSLLYARYAVLMDADTGRILFAKSAEEEAPMASTTKIMTCILALESGELTEEVKVSGNAQSQPQVKLGMKSGQRFYLEDLLYSLMLESHNDSAVAIAEHVGGDVQGFADMMNGKAKEIGCQSTYFITPNGLDAEDENGVHHTTAYDLALIMRYCIMESPRREEFLEITRAASHSFTDVEKKSSYSCTNHNAFLKMMDGALTGKTGFTGDAGYCYVGALRQDERTFIVALLACGWPNNKGYKWADTKRLMEYGLDNYAYRDITPQEEQGEITVRNGYTGAFPGGGDIKVPVSVKGSTVSVLLNTQEEVKCEMRMPDFAEAPVEKGGQIGEAVFTVDGICIAVCPVCIETSVSKRTFSSCLQYIAESYF